MAFMVWNDRLMTGIAAIDSDHRRLVRMINDLYDAIGAGEGQGRFPGLLARLMEYTQMHFAREERLFAATDYADRGPHKAEHAQMVAWLEGMAAKHQERSETALSLEMMTYLKDWLFDHILGSDQRYVAHLRAAGVR